jgi:hypothetical protein
MKYRISLFVAALAALPLFAQQGPGHRPPVPQLTRYLELSPEQQAGLLRIQAEWQRFLAQKQQRVTQVERELSQETNANVPDPLSLGLRYAELEAICRESRDKDRENLASARKLLTAAQTTKLQTLEAAYLLLPIVAEADQAGLMQAPLLNPLPQNAPLGGIPAANILQSGRYPGCKYPARLAD